MDIYIYISPPTHTHTQTHTYTLAILHSLVNGDLKKKNTWPIASGVHPPCMLWEICQHFLDCSIWQQMIQSLKHSTFPILHSLTVHSLSVHHGFSIWSPFLQCALSFTFFRALLTKCSPFDCAAFTYHLLGVQSLLSFEASLE